MTLLFYYTLLIMFFYTIVAATSMPAMTASEAPVASANLWLGKSFIAQASSSRTFSTRSSRWAPKAFSGSSRKL